MAIKRVLGLVLGLFSGGLVALVGACGLVLGARPAAAAVPFSMSGLFRNYCCSKVAIGTPVTPTVITGDYTAYNTATPTLGGAVLDSRPSGPGALPQGGSPGSPFGLGAPPASTTRPSGKVYQTGLPNTANHRATLTLPKNAFHLTNYYQDFTHGSTWTYIRTTLDLYNQTATFMEGQTFPSAFATTGGSNYQFCRAQTGGLSYCTQPPGLTGPNQPSGLDTQYPWMVRIHPGQHHFGGTWQMLGGGPGGFGFGGVAKFKPPGYGGVNRNVYFSFLGGTGNAIPAQYSLLNIIKFTLNGSPFPLVPYPPTSPTTYLATIPNVSFQTNAPFTTGTISVYVSNPTSPFVYQRATLMGSDNRTASGQGNISLVTPTVYSNSGNHHSFPRPTRINLSLPEPGVTVALGAGMAALFGLGRLRRRRERLA